MRLSLWRRCDGGAPLECCVGDMIGGTVYDHIPSIRWRRGFLIHL